MTVLPVSPHLTSIRRRSLDCRSIVEIPGAFVPLLLPLLLPLLEVQLAQLLIPLLVPRPVQVLVSRRMLVFAPAQAPLLLPQSAPAWLPL